MYHIIDDIFTNNIIYDMIHSDLILGMIDSYNILFQF